LYLLETLASFLALNPLDHHTGLLYSESPIDCSDSEQNINIDLYKLVYNFDGHSLQNAIAELIANKRCFQGCFLVAPAERRHSLDKAIELSKALFNQLIPACTRLLSNPAKALLEGMVALILLRGAHESGTSHGELLAIDVYGFTCPFSKDYLSKISKRIDSVDADITSVYSPPSSPRPLPVAQQPSSDVVVVLDDSDDDSSKPAPAPAPAPPPSSDAVPAEQAPAAGSLPSRQETGPHGGSDDTAADYPSGQHGTDPGNRDARVLEPAFRRDGPKRLIRGARRGDGDSVRSACRGAEWARVQCVLAAWAKRVRRGRL
jgi:hypothetical protein